MIVEVLELVEYDDRPVSDEVVAAVDPDFWRDTGITVSRSPKQGGWRARPDSFAGIARTKQANVDLTVVIRPKLKTADVIFLAEHAYGQRVDALRRPRTGRVGIDSTYQDPVAALLIWYVEAVSEFATRWLRRNYRSRQVTLHGKVRGRFLISRYVSQHLATGRNAEIPAIVTERTIDTANNRVLKAGLRRVLKLAAALPVPAARVAVRAAVNSALPRFAEVADETIGPAQLRATSTSGPERHYAGILRATTDLLGGKYLGITLGSTETDSFLWSMPHLFQEALRSILETSPHAVLDASTRPSGTIHDDRGTRLRSSRIDPDYVLHTATGSVLVDAKYKDALGFRDTEPDDDVTIGPTRIRIRISRNDLYQMIAYRQQERWAGAKTVLVYPVVVGKDEPLPLPYEFRGIGAPVSLAFFDIGPFARSHVSAFNDALFAIVSDRPHRQPGASNGATEAELRRSQDSMVASDNA